MDTSHLHLSKNLSITFHVFPWHYKLWDELVRISVWNGKKTNRKQGESFTVQSSFLQYVTFTECGSILQDTAQFHTIFLLFFVYEERLYIVPDILNFFINTQLL
jgi:hypothetical protein